MLQTKDKNVKLDITLKEVDGKRKVVVKEKNTGTIVAFSNPAE